MYSLIRINSNKQIILLLKFFFPPVLGEALININFENMHPISLLYSDTKTLCKAEEETGGALPCFERTE